MNRSREYEKHCREHGFVLPDAPQIPPMPAPEPMSRVQRIIANVIVVAWVLLILASVTLNVIHWLKG
jgi:hypothetical protein